MVVHAVGVQRDPSGGAVSGNIKSELIDMLYMYYGSLKNYDESWTLSLEQFVNYLHGTILKDKRFDDKIDSEKRDEYQLYILQADDDSPEGGASSGGHAQP